MGESADEAANQEPGAHPEARRRQGSGKEGVVRHVHHGRNPAHSHPAGHHAYPTKLHAGKPTEDEDEDIAEALGTD